MADRKANFLITLVFDKGSDIEKQVDTESALKNQIIKDLQHLVAGKEIKHFVVADDGVINKKLTEGHKVGKWIEIKNKNGTTIALRCDYCEKSPKHAIRSLYCPNCGTKMESVENE